MLKRCIGSYGNSGRQCEQINYDRVEQLPVSRGKYQSAKFRCCSSIER